MTKTGYESVGIDEVRSELRKAGIDDEEFLSNTKTVLVSKLLEMNDTKEHEDLVAIFDDAEEAVEDEVMQPYSEEEATEIMPAYASEAWHEYVMLKFRDDELQDGAPTCDGCRRVIESVLGPIVNEEKPRSTPPSTTNNNTATVVARIEILVTNESHPLNGRVVCCEEIADVNKDNCDHPYYKHPSATASTRAESRALRKLLRLRNTITAEEKSENAESTDNELDWQVDEPISDSQITAIDLICSRVDMDVIGFINSGRGSFDDIHMVKKSTAQRMIQELNKIQREVKLKPETVQPYNAGWRSNGE